MLTIRGRDSGEGRGEKDGEGGDQGEGNMNCEHVLTIRGRDGGEEGMRRVEIRGGGRKRVEERECKDRGRRIRRERG